MFRESLCVGLAILAVRPGEAIEETLDFDQVSSRDVRVDLRGFGVGVEFFWLYPDLSTR